MQENNEIMEAKNDLINLYLKLKPRKIEDVIKIIYNHIILFIQEENNLQEKNNEELEKLIYLSIKDIIEYIKSSIDIIVSIKVDEELEKYNQDNPNAANDYETLLRKEEQSIRQHISTENQLKIQCEKFKEKMEQLENEKNIIIEEIVSNIFIFNLIFILTGTGKRAI